ncbi:MAG: hypothetical protein QM523_05110 [Candidatus Pacebacteria bacterium]|nr:hypothetical protein [Candidatus Paceibacterota bacterium]
MFNLIANIFIALKNIWEKIPHRKSLPFFLSVTIASIANVFVAHQNLWQLSFNFFIFIIASHDVFLRMRHAIALGNLMLAFEFSNVSQIKSFRKAIGYACHDPFNQDRYFIIEKIVIKLNCKPIQNNQLLNIGDRELIWNQCLKNYYTEIERPIDQPPFGFIENQTTTVAVHRIIDKEIYGFQYMTNADLIESMEKEIYCTYNDVVTRNHPKITFKMSEKSITIKFFRDFNASFDFEHKGNIYEFLIYPIITGHFFNQDRVKLLKKCKKSVIGHHIQEIERLAEISQQGLKQFRIEIS